MSDQSSLIPLVHFDRTFLSPLLSGGHFKSRNDEELFLAGLVEAYFWLRLGVDIGYFPAHYARQLARHRLTPLVSGWKQLLDDRGDVFAPTFKVLLQTIDVDSQVGIVTPNNEFADERQLHRFFRHALALEAESIADELLVTAFGALTFLNLKDLEDVFLRNHTLDGRLRMIVDRALFDTQFPKMMLHTRSFAALDRAVDNASLREDGAVFKRRVHELTRWRLNQRLDSVNRFLPRVVALYFERHQQEIGIGYEEFQDWARASTRGWELTHGLSALSAGGSSR
jgi:hypothetical protein